MITAISDFLMQSYGDFQMNPNNSVKPSLTCLDKRPDYGQIEENGEKVVYYLCCLRLICYICGIK